jgi:hypothetical protein
MALVLMEDVCPPTIRVSFPETETRKYRDGLGEIGLIRPERQQNPRKNAEGLGGGQSPGSFWYSFLQ